MNYTAEAKATLARRASLVAEMRSVHKGTDLSEVEKRKRIEALDLEINELEVEARDYVERGEREASVRQWAAQNPGFAKATIAKGQEPDSDEWRGLLPSMAEYRAVLMEGTPSAGGYAVPKGTASKYVDMLMARSVFLKGLPVSNIIEFDTSEFTMPQIISSDEGSYVNEGDVIPEGGMTFAGLKFEAKAIKEMRYATNELLDDAAFNLRELLGTDMLRSASVKLDRDAFSGSGTNPVKGIIGQGVTTTLVTGLVSYDALADSVGRIESANGVASVVWAAPDVAAGLRKEKATNAGTFQGGSPTDAPTNTAWGLPVFSSASIPIGTAIVADASRIFFGLRKGAEVRISEDLRFDQDQTAFRLVMRCAGILVAESSSVQIVKAAS